MPLFKRSLKRALPELSGAVFEQRWQFLITEAVVGQWARARLLMTPGTDHASWTPAKERLYLERYFEYVEGGLTAPMTA